MLFLFHGSFHFRMVGLFVNLLFRLIKRSICFSILFYIITFAHMDASSSHMIWQTFSVYLRLASYCTCHPCVWMWHTIMSPSELQMSWIRCFPTTIFVHLVWVDFQVFEFSINLNEHKADAKQKHGERKKVRIVGRKFPSFFNYRTRVRWLNNN